MQGALNLEYLRADEVAGYLEKQHGHVLGVVAFGSHLDKPLQSLLPSPLWVHIPVLNPSLANSDNSFSGNSFSGNSFSGNSFSGNSFEVWTSSRPVSACGQGNIRASADGSILLGSLQMEQAAGVAFETLVERAYLEIFSFIERAGYRHLLRVWNYFPGITDDEHGMERYRCFNLGRHAAFVSTGRDTGLEGVPAASVLGSEQGPLLIYFLAGAQPGQAIENPRQLNAYRYPEQYGPRSPTFVRAMLATLGQQQCLAISGTASIVGHETMHAGNVDMQTQETLLNMRTLLRQVPGLNEDAGRMLLKVYLRRPEDLERISTQVVREFGSNHKAVYLLSSICRTDLLMEIEGVCFKQAQG